MASTAGFPLFLHQDETSILMLSDSEDEDGPPTPREPLHSQDPSRATSRATSRAESIDQDEDMVRKNTQDVASNVPLHPIPAMQPAFAESLVEATADPPVPKPKLRFGDAKERRARLIDAEKDTKLYTELWRYRPGQTHHELFKLMAQISFGVYLLLNGIANSNVQVVNILQGHIDEVDEFLEVTMEDIQLATDDIQERIDFLRLPMQNISTFEKMLEDRAFRLQIVTGNEKIEHIVNRTAAALEASLTDVEEGLKSTKEFAIYLGDQQNRPWRAARPDVIDIFDAMKGNAEGWYKAFVDLQASTSVLDTLLIKLGQMVADMDRRAGEVSRRTRFSVAPFTGSNLEASRVSIISPQASRKSSQRSSSSRAHSASFSSRTESIPIGTRSPSQKSPPSSPNVRDTLPDFQFKPLQLRPRAASKNGPILEIDTTALAVEEEPKETLRPSPIEEEGLYLLQPRTYTPLPPEPLPSPMVRNPPSPRASRPASPQQEDDWYQDGISIHEEVPIQVEIPIQVELPRQEPLPKRTSLRQRLSLKGSHPPETIQIPPRNMNRPNHQSPRVQYGHQLPAPDSAYASDMDTRPPARSMIGNSRDFSPPVFPNTIPSPLSDQQYFRPVQASPHSPLQRPWTSGTTPMQRPHTSATQYQHAGHQRNAPSAMGMSMLSNVTTMNNEGKTLKKKRSAFGWLKKAFALDEEERAAFEAKKQQQTPNLYYEGRSPKYLDGRRRDDYRRY